jgi:hypothetical protein
MLALAVLEFMLLGFFCLEILIRILAEGIEFLRDVWNVTDLLLLVVRTRQYRKVLWPWDTDSA